MSISIDQIKSLRERTGVSMSSCKSALEQTNGDEEKAIDILRKKGESKAAERADRNAVNGVIAIAQKDGKAAMVSLACETDFVAKSPDFIAKAQEMANRLLAEGETADFSKEISDLLISLGEKIEVKEKKLVSGTKLGTYVHMNNKIGVIVVLSGGSDELCKDIAMHTAAMSPKNLSPEEISADLVAKEREIWAEQLKNEGKPAEIVGKIMDGKEKKFREEFALLTQAFVKDPSKIVKDLLGDTKIEGFTRFEI
ncbi:MAG: translation elongation factor Ts [Candidatus Gracilibacteria bacterium]